MSGNNNYTSNILALSASTASLNSASQAAAGTTSMFARLLGTIRKMGESTSTFNAINQGLQSFSGKMDAAIAPGAQLNVSLADLSAMTGVTGKGLKEIEHYARASAKTFGGTATQSADTYKLILSQLSPEIAKVPSALAQMGQHTATTAKIMGGDTTAATQLLTTAMTQFEVSLNDPTQASGTMGEMMNIMASAAKSGTAQLPQIKMALEQSGTAARTSGVSFAETNTAIQMLDKSGKKGSEGGIALRKVLESLSQSAVLPDNTREQLSAAGIDIRQLSDHTLSLSDRLKPLRTIMQDSALVSKIFGQENQAAALTLISGSDTMDTYTASIRNTNTATDQASIIMDTYSETMSRQKAWVDDLKIGLFNFTAGIMPYVNAVSTFFQSTASVISGVNAIATFAESAWAQAIKKRTKALFDSTKAMFSAIGSMGFYNTFTLVSVATTYAFSYALKAVGKAIYSIPIIGWIAAGISVVITAFTLLWEKCEGFRRGIFAVVEVVKAVFYNIGVVVKAVWENLLKPYLMFWWDLVKIVASGIWSAMQWCWDGIVSGFTAVSDFFTSLWDGVMSGVSALGEFFSGIWTWISDTCGGVATFISGVFSSIAEPIKAVFAPVFDFVSGIFNKITEAVSKFFNWIGNMWNKLFPKDKFKDLGEAAEKGLAKGSESFRKSEEAKKQQDGASIAENTPAFTPPAFLPATPPATKNPPVISNTYKTGEKAKGRKAAAGETSGDTAGNDLKVSSSYGAITAGITAVQPGMLTPAAKSPAGKTAATLSKAPATPPKTDPFSPAKPGSPANPESEAGQTDYLKNIALSTGKIAAGMALLVGITALGMQNPASLPAANTEKFHAETQGRDKATAISAAQEKSAIPFLAAAPPRTVPESKAHTAIQDVPAATGTNPLIALQNRDYTPRTPEFATQTETSPAPGNPFAENRGLSPANGKQINFAKFCENIVINIPSGTANPQEIAEQVKREIMTSINNSLDNYDA